MKKIIAFSAFMLMMVGTVKSADQVITVSIPSAKVAVALDGFLKIHPNDEKDEKGKFKYTDKEWVDECVRRYVVREVYRGTEMIRQDTGKTVYDDNVAVRAK